jgi:hypothetical protein
LLRNGAGVQECDATGVATHTERLDNKNKNNEYMPPLFKKNSLFFDLYNFILKKYKRILL